MSRILSTRWGGGCLPQCMLGYTPRDQAPPWDQAHSPPEQTPPDQAPFPPGADTPQGTDPRDQTHPPRSRPPRADSPRADPPLDQAPLQTRHPLGADTPPPGADTPREADCSIRSTSDRRASYWNAFLFLYFIYSAFLFCFYLFSFTNTKS